MVELTVLYSDKREFCLLCEHVFFIIDNIKYFFFYYKKSQKDVLYIDSLVLILRLLLTVLVVDFLILIYKA